ncbi:MAG: DoxX family membrane protein [Francisellaceae bacterium]|jgi:putative oxidoreductase|nr:DoxX family membrane protein [Francisellaceae bacterium]MBT6207470.1 DoxX family membrane protein [Francisellaceae bacterium]MBT6539232.1 DoxX family membrane protein [Francisellaceae bacterium]
MLGKLCCSVLRKSTTLLNFISHIVNLGVRIYLFNVFFSSALTKIKDFSTTMFLFEHEYKSTWLPLPPSIVKNLGWDIPIMPVSLAAYSGTALELLLPFALLLGFGARIPALALFMFNYVAAVSYPFLWTKSGLVGLQNHYFWGALLLMLIFYGSGNLSCDTYLKARFCKKKNIL